MNDTMYEVHISRHRGVATEARRIVVRDEDTCMHGIATIPSSLFLRTGDHAVAQHVAEVHERTARRADDRHAWIKTIEGTN